MPIHPASTAPASNDSAPTTPVRAPRHLRACATRAAVVATAAAAVLAVLPATGATPAAAPAAPTSTAAAPVVTAPVVTVPVVPVAASSYSRPVPTGNAMELALSKVGSPYRWGAAGPSSFDCSGLVSWAFANAGITLPRTSRAQSQTGIPIDRADLQPGDLVFFYTPVSHVGIYVGNGQVVHASTAGKPVAVADMSRMPFHSARRI